MVNELGVSTPPPPSTPSTPTPTPLRCWWRWRRWWLPLRSEISPPHPPHPHRRRRRRRRRHHHPLSHALRNIQSKLKSDTESRVVKSKLRLDTERMKENVTRPSNSPEAKRNSPVDGSKPRQFLKRGTLDQRQAEARAANYARVREGGGRCHPPHATTATNCRPTPTAHGLPPPTTTSPVTRPSRRRGKRWVTARRRCRAGRR